MGSAYNISDSVASISELCGLMCSDGVRFCEDRGNVVIAHFIGVGGKQASTHWLISRGVGLALVCVAISMG
jgi:hypothetical protein